MRISSLILCFSSVTAALGQQAPKPAIVDGRVLNAITGEPLRKVDVKLSTGEDMDANVKAMLAQLGGAPDKPSAEPAKSANKSFSVPTDANGKFHLEADAGEYDLTAKRAGFVDGSYQPEGKYDVDGRLRLQAGDELSKVEIRMTPFGSISGRVIDEDGDPVTNSMVLAVKLDYSTGHRQTSPVDYAQTTGKGEYHLDKLPPGRYFISAAAAMDPASMIGPAPPAPKDGSPESGYVTTYYPKVTDAAQAGRVDVAAAAELSGFDIQLQKSRVARIQGRVLGDDGAPLKSGQIMLMSPANMGSMRMSMLNNPEGKFEIAGVQPGSYSLMVMQMGGSAPKMRMVPVTVTEEGVKDFVVGAQKDGAVHGRLKVYGDRPLALKGINLMLTGEEGMAVMPSFTTAAETGEFTFDKVASGAFRLSVNGLHGAYLKSVEWGGHDQLGERLDFSAGFAGQLEVTLGTDGGEYEATVKRDDKPASGATVVLIAADPAARIPERTRTGVTDSTGHVDMKDVPPGSYLVFAWEKVEHGDWFDQSFLKRFETQGVSVTLQPNGHEKSDLKLIVSK